jgi:isopentenyl-diphosphate delta-isomerase
MTQLIPAWIDGVLTPVDKIGVHRRGLRHQAVSVFVIADGALLMQRRALGKYHTPGLWSNTCCTHPAWGEAPRDCAVRRLDEELGLTGLDPELRGQVEYRADVSGGMIEHEVVDIFLARADARPALAPNPDEVMETAWTELAELVEAIAEAPDRFTPWLRIYLRDHKTGIFG